MKPAEDSVSTVEWQILLACAAPTPEMALLEQRLRAPFDWNVLLSLAEPHGVVPLLARRLGQLKETNLPAEFRQCLREKRRVQLASTLALTGELFRLTKGFDGAGIDAVAVKGPVLAAQAFGDPSLRQYSDLDLLVRHGDVLPAAKLMCESGYVPQISLEAAAAGRVPGQFLFMRRETNLIVELHTERTLRYFPRPLPIVALLGRRVPILLDGREVSALSPEDTLGFICVHGSKHLWERLMWIADVAALVTRPQAFNWSRAFAAAKEVGAERMLHLGLLLAMNGLQAEVPLEAASAARSDRVARRLAEAVLRQLSAGENAERSVLDRALFRARMCGGLPRGFAYLLRLSFSPTEEDWRDAATGKRARAMEVLRRLFRLLRKYGRRTRGLVSSEERTGIQGKKARA